MIGPGRFVLRFLLAFALLLVIGAWTRMPAGWAGALEASARVVLPPSTGWWIEGRQGPKGAETWLRRGERQVRFQLSLERSALSLYPFGALLLATPGLGFKRAALSALIGAGALFLLNLGVIALYPWLVSSPSAVTGILGYLLGMLTFVGGPVILWFLLTFRQLRGLWRL